MIYQFDCSQFFCLKTRLDPSQLEKAGNAIREFWLGDVLVDEAISAPKTDYLRKLGCPSQHVIELVGAEYQGVFEDWSVETEVPHDVAMLVASADRLQSYLHDEVTMVLVASATTDISRVAKLSASGRKGLLHCLFSRSLFYTGDSAGMEVLVIQIEPES